MRLNRGDKDRSAPAAILANMRLACWSGDMQKSDPDSAATKKMAENNVAKMTCSIKIGSKMTLLMNLVTQFSISYAANTTPMIIMNMSITMMHMISTIMANAKE